MKLVLFVDDDPHVMQKLRPGLRPMRGAWELSFAGRGAEANPNRRVRDDAYRPAGR